MYWFLDENNQVLYVGKAKELKRRVSSYTRISQLSSRIKRMVVTAKTVRFKELKSELEALLTEAELIRRYQPQFNVLLKDDKSPLYIVITNEKFPRVLQIRKKELHKLKNAAATFGPFQSAYKVREVLQLVRPIFPWCNQTGNAESATQRPCFYYHIDRCPGACTGNITPAEYQPNIDRLITFLRGKTGQVVDEMETAMQAAAEQELFELAAELRDKISLIKDVTGQKKRLKPTLTTPGLTSQLAHDGTVYLQDILAEYLHMPRQYPLNRIEAYDVSNIHGKHAAVAMVTFTDGKPAPAEYRLFNIRSIDTPNDYHMLREALARRQNHPEWGMPDLVIMDGGKGQVRAALSTWTWEIPVIGIAKRPDRLIVPLLSPTEQSQEITTKTPINYQVLSLPATHPGLKLVQQLRDEAHRFSKKQHSRRRMKALLK